MAEDGAEVAVKRAGAARAIDWAAVERDYRAGAGSLAQVAVRHGVSRAGIYKHARKHGWQRGGTVQREAEKMEAARAQAANHHERVTVDRLHRLVRRLTRELERRLAGEETDPSVLGERESTAQILNALTRAVAGLAALERDKRKEQIINTKAEEDADAMGADVAWDAVERRLARLAAEGGAPAVPG